MVISPQVSATRKAYALIGLAMLLGLSLRIAGAQGGLWLDEAWSADFARKARSPFDIFFVIHHDNNHYLNTLWLYLTGWGAPPMMSRLLSIATGTLTILLGGLIGLRRGPAQGVLLALFFAISPMLVAYGAEARGYAPMFLALTLMIWVLSRWFDAQQSPAPSRLLALITALGMLSHLTMLFALIGIGLWAAAVLARGRTLRALIATLFDLFGLSIIVAGGIIVMAMVVPLLGPVGFQFGGYDPFSLRTLGIGLSVLFEYTLGLRGPLAYAILLTLALLLPLLASRPIDRNFLLLCGASLLTVPILFIVAQIANAAFGRYQLLTCFGILLVASDIIASGWARKGWQRPLAFVALAVLVVGQMSITLSIVANKRADPSVAINAMASRAPAGATIFVGHGRDTPVLEAAAASVHYPLRVEKEPCSGAGFIFLAAPDLPELPPETTACSARYLRVTDRARTELSGMSWRLYQRIEDQAARRSSAARSTS